MSHKKKEHKHKEENEMQGNEQENVNASQADDVSSMQQENAQDENDNNVAENESDEFACELQKLKEQLADNNQALMRERADFVNFRKRSAQEKADMQVRIAGNFLNDMLPAMDAFDQLFTMREKAQKEEKAVVVEEFFKGIDLIYQQIWQVFAQMDFEEINPANQEFDPNFMEALALEERDDVQSETVVQVFQKGFKTKSRVLRPARVVVAKPKAEQPQTSQEEN